MTRGQLLLIAVGVTFLVPGPIYVITGFAGGGGVEGDPALVLALTAVIAVIHIRHTLAAVRGDRPTGWPLTFAVLVVVVYAPLDAWEYNWASQQWFVCASALMLLRPLPLAAAVAAVPVVGTAAFAWDLSVAFDESGPAAATYWIGGLLLGGVGLYGAVRLVRAWDELATARAQLAEAAVGRERLRVSRDLHDHLGQSLSAVSLKGDLALALLQRDPAAARAEIESLTAAAREALAGVRTIPHDRHSLTLADEVDGALALLAAAGVAARAEIDVDGVSEDVKRLLAWAVREGVTNVLRHSEATRCSIAATVSAGAIRLEIANDGVDRPQATGSGLAGLDARARVLGGAAVARAEGRRFLLELTVPARQEALT